MLYVKPKGSTKVPVYNSGIGVYLPKEGMAVPETEELYYRRRETDGDVEFISEDEFKKAQKQVSSKQEAQAAKAPLITDVKMNTEISRSSSEKGK